MSGFRVDLDRMNRLITDLDHAADDITAANQLLHQSTARDLGTPGIDRAAEQFQQRWGESISSIGDAAKRTSDGLDETRKTYAELEEQVARMFHSGQHPQSPPPAPPAASAEQPSAIEQRLNP